MSVALSDVWKRREVPTDGYLFVLTQENEGGRAEPCVMLRETARKLFLSFGDKDAIAANFALYDKVAEQGVPVLIHCVWRDEHYIGVISVADLNAGTVGDFAIRPLAEALAEAGL